MTSAGGSGSVDHEIVGYDQNLSRALALRARGGGEEHRGGGFGPYGRRSGRRRPSERRRLAEHGGSAAQGVRGREERMGWITGSPR